MRQAINPYSMAVVPFSSMRNLISISASTLLRMQVHPSARHLRPRKERQLTPYLSIFAKALVLNAADLLRIGVQYAFSDGISRRFLRSAGQDAINTVWTAFRIRFRYSTHHRCRQNRCSKACRGENQRYSPQWSGSVFSLALLGSRILISIVENHSTSPIAEGGNWPNRWLKVIQIHKRSINAGISGASAGGISSSRRRLGRTHFMASCSRAVGSPSHLRQI